jgi:protein-tyrosine kinase
MGGVDKRHPLDRNMSRIEAALNKARALARGETGRYLTLGPPERLALTDGQLGSLGLADLSVQELAAAEALQPLTRRQWDKGRLIHPGTREDPLANAFWELRARVLQRNLGPTCAIQAVPVDHHAGGSFVAVNLAIALSLDEAASAVLIDCNFSAPACARHLAVDVGLGLSDFLATPDLSPSAIVYRTAFPRLLLVPAGAKRDAGGGQFMSSRMRRLMGALKAYPGERAIVLDGPAATQPADVSSLAEMADAVVLVVAYGRSTRSAITAAVNLLDLDKRLGVVFNNEPSVGAFF